ncbi:uncharacterized protein LACBIDRAFT_330322 [Laccaria bicolor S238N-H82]|uniref:Predicted protein n=1 Tax=Laccaria bicolor (strain S238N-H82 / ATCC MYA-4686) TaxID=486041 RepID=B0DKX5_LACBS|nr:uncharacterized protein LACBIDRAFT_330322 [Laccaria bicolor S238N-H82]EDR04723.1 predicted protein [Laccaria bicolor S238N-H82]|eukprot:XP_001884547.1 predicted protein [Laccaria bicolor S238N-H82]
MKNLGFATFIVLFERGSFVIAGTVRYLSTTSILPENMRSIHMTYRESHIQLTTCTLKPRIIVPKHPSRDLAEISFVPIKGNRILLFAKYLEKITYKAYLHLSIDEIRADDRVGRALWSFNGSVDGHFNIDDLELIKSTRNPLGITFGVRFDDHCKLFDISTTDTDASDKFPLIESGKVIFALKLTSKSENDKSLVMLSPSGHILLNANLERNRRDETIDIHYSDSGRKNNVDFSFITRISLPIAGVPKVLFQESPLLAFSADASRFAIAIGRRRVSVWDVRNKVPLKTFMEDPKSDDHDRHVRHLQFSSGKLGKEALVFVERDHSSSLEIIHVIDATSFETEEILPLNLEELNDYERYIGVGLLFFETGGGTLYAELNGILYEWYLRKNNHGPEWWIGEYLLLEVTNVQAEET